MKLLCMKKRWVSLNIAILALLSVVTTFATKADTTPVVNRFEWSPSTFVVGQSSTFYWDISNVKECYGVTATNPGAPRAKSGSSGPFVYSEPQLFTTSWYCIDLAGNRFPSNPNQYLTATRTVLASAPTPVVNRFEWMPTPVIAGQSATFYWDISNVRECYALTGTVPSAPRAKSGSSGPFTYVQPEVFTSRWYCIDFAGNRFPANANQYLEAVRNVVAPGYTVTAIASAGGTVSPSSRQVTQGGSTTFSIFPDSGYEISTASGCNGSRNGSVYITGSITGPCTINISFLRSSTGGVSYIHTDIQGSVIAESDENGTIKKKTEYKPFGESVDN